MRNQVVIIGAGVAGLTAGYVLRKAGIETSVIEKRKEPGGLSQSFIIGDEWFDTAAHVLFAGDPWVRSLLEDGIDCRENPFEAYNYKQGQWIRNPVQNNLFPLSVEEKIRIITDYVNRNAAIEPRNYKEWLRASYGEYFSANYPDLYTRKYWTVEPENLETQWVGERMYRPDLEEILQGAFSAETKNVHYTKMVRYPVKGGFGRFVNKLIEDSRILCNREIKEIDTKRKEICCSDGQRTGYDYLINTAPLTEIIRIVGGAPEEVLSAAKRLHATQLLLVSVLVRGELHTDYATMYIYDENILASRVYSATKYRREQNGVSAIQAEVYYSEFKPLMDSVSAVKDQVIHSLAEIGCYDIRDVLETDVRWIPYANIIFTSNIYRDRRIVREYLESRSILCAGRFGEWDYLWTEQAMLSGKRAAEKVIERIKGSAA